MTTALVLLIVGFGLDAASAFTTAFSRRWGKTGGQVVSFVLRVVLGIPLWVVGLALAVRLPSEALFVAPSALPMLGWVLLFAGATVQTFAIVSLGLRAATPSVDDTLAARGVYAWVRHPIYAGLLLQFVGVVLVQPRRIVLLAAALGCVWVFIQARLEEKDLLERMPAYREYMDRVPRFVPRVFRKADV